MADRRRSASCQVAIRRQGVHGQAGSSPPVPHDSIIRSRNPLTSRKPEVRLPRFDGAHRRQALGAGLAPAEVRLPQAQGARGTYFLVTASAGILMTPISVV